MSAQDDLTTGPGLAMEPCRLKALLQVQPPDTPAEQAFDDLAWLAAKLCDTPMALVSVAECNRQWFKASFGLDAHAIPRTIACCAHALAEDAPLEVPDALTDVRFADSPLVTAQPGIRFYAGAPLIGRHGHRYGTLCVLDTKPRQLEPAQREGLQRLAHRVSANLEERRERLEAEAREQTLVHLLEAMPNGVVTCGADGQLGEFNKEARNWHGVDPRALPAEDWASHFDLYEPGGNQLLRTDQIPLLRAWNGEQVREAEIVIRAKGQLPRTVLCNAEPLTSGDGARLGAVCVMHDVTHLRAAQEAVEVEARRFSGAFAAAAQGMALVALDGRCLEVNEAMCEIFGYRPEELLQLDFQRLTHPEDLSTDLALVAEVLRGKRGSYQLDKRYFHKSGHTIHAHLSVSLVRDFQGQPLHFVSQVHDFSQRHRIEQRLRESELRFRSVLENSHDAFIAVDESETILEWNRAAEATFGWQRSEVLGKRMSDVILPPRMRDAHHGDVGRFVQSGESRALDQRLQLATWHRSGYEFPVEMTVTEVQLGDHRVFNAFMHDISQRIAAETELRDSEVRLRTIADNVPALIGHVGSDLRYRFVNRPYADWLGLPTEAIVGRHISEVLRTEHFDELRPRLDRALAGETLAFDMDVVDRQGELRHMHATLVPDLRDASGGSTAVRVCSGLHLMLHDLTAQTRLARVLKERALTDTLTGLPNREAWSEELERGLARANRARAPAAVMFIDLDGFKQINDTYGHAAGDAVLRAFADRLRANLRLNDFIARLSGDEFVVLLDSVSDALGDPPRVANKIILAMKQEIIVDGQRLSVTASIGLAIQRGPVFDAERLMSTADHAMYIAKRDPDCHYVLREC